LEDKVLKEDSGMEGNRMMRPQKVLESLEDGKETKKRTPNSRLLAELKGVPEKGKLAKPIGPDKTFISRRVNKMGELVRGELIREIAANKLPNFDYDIRIGRPEIIDVVMSSDLKRAKVVWIPPGLANSDDDRVKKDWAKRFESSRGYLRNMLATRIRTRFVPELEFQIDSIQNRIDVEVAPPSPPPMTNDDDRRGRRKMAKKMTNL